MPGPQKIKDKSKAYEVALKPLTLAQMADELGVSKERARQIRLDAGAAPIKNLTQALAEIRRLQSILDERQRIVVA